MSADGPDIHQLRQDDLAATAFPGGSKQPFRVYFTPDIHSRIWRHAQETTAVEICGILVGKLAKDDSGPFATITEAIRGEAASNKFAEVTFTHETWAKINHEMDTKYSHLAIVGWYHSHPDFGIFLSDRDLFIQQHFFSGPGQIAFVVDPVRHIEGVFVWKKGKPTLAPHYWVGDRIQIGGTSSLLHEPTHQPAASAADNPGVAPVRPPALGPWFDRIILGLGLLSLFLLGWLLAQYLTSLDRARIEQDAIARAALVLGVRPGLRERLAQRILEMDDLAKLTDALAKAHRALGQLPEDQERAWHEVRSGMQKMRFHLADLQAQYCLSETETQRLIQYAAAVMALNTQGLTPSQQQQLARELEAKMLQGVQQGLFEAPSGLKELKPGGSAPSPSSAATMPAPDTKPASGKPPSSAPSVKQ